MKKSIYCCQYGKKIAEEDKENLHIRCTGKGKDGHKCGCINTLKKTQGG
jgi:hypothetical protein